jgi:hypothetical protein
VVRFKLSMYVVKSLSCSSLKGNFGLNDPDDTD